MPHQKEAMMSETWGVPDPHPATFVPIRFTAGFNVADDQDDEAEIEELEVHYGDDGHVTIFLCGTEGVRDGMSGPWNNGSDVAHLTLSADQRRLLALVLLRGLPDESDPVVNGEHFAPGYTPEAAAYEQRTRPSVHMVNTQECQV